MYCKNCGKQLNSDVNFCKYCGKLVTKNEMIGLNQLIENTEKERFATKPENSKITISYLNSKAWFRLLKVIYALLLIIILLGYNLFVFSVIGLKQIDQNKTLIQCNVGTLKTFTPDDIKINLNNNDFKNDIFDYEQFFINYNDLKIKNIFKECNGEPLNSKDTYDVFVIQRLHEIIDSNRKEKASGGDSYLTPKRSLDEIFGIKNTNNNNYLDNEIKKITTGYKTNQEKASYLDFSVKFFDIKPVFTYDTFIQYFVIGNVIILFIFEFMKRIFYYIFTGKIIPSK